MVTYFGTQGKGLLAAFTALFPAATVVTMVTIHGHHICKWWGLRNSRLFQEPALLITSLASVCDIRYAASAQTGARSFGHHRHCSLYWSCISYHENRALKTRLTNGL